MNHSSSMGITRPTLARKFEAVHRNTVTHNRNIPSALLPTFSNPIFPMNPFDFGGSLEDDTDILTRFSEGRGPETSKSSGAASIGTAESWALMAGVWYIPFRDILLSPFGFFGLLADCFSDVRSRRTQNEERVQHGNRQVVKST